MKLVDIIFSNTGSKNTAHGPTSQVRPGCLLHDTSHVSNRQIRISLERFPDQKKVSLTPPLQAKGPWKPEF
jgi:hypothetical protein